MMIIKLDEFCKLRGYAAEEVQAYEFWEDNQCKTLVPYEYAGYYERWMYAGYPVYQCEFYVPEEYHNDYDKWIADGCPMERNPNYDEEDNDNG